MEPHSAQQLWKAALGELQIQVNKANYHTWLRNTSGLSYQDQHFVVGVPNTFVAEYLEKNQRSLIEKILTSLVHEEIQVEFEVSNHQPNAPSSNHRPEKHVPPQQASLPLFNPRYTFDSFVVGSGNQLAYVAALRVAQSPGQSYNPLFIYGAAGLGKTHLLHAIGHTALANSIRVLYVSAEQYTNDLMNALREKKTDDFRNKYRSVDMLLVDDVQFFSGKEQTGESFFHTFDELHNASHQIAITSDRPPKAITSVSERLRSRFEGGLVTDIQPPDFETRLTILQTKAQREGVNLSLEVLELIARQIEQNVRVLEGSLNRVIAYAKLVQTMLTPELAARALKDIGEPQTGAITPGVIIGAVANSFHLTPSALQGRQRDKEIVLARRVAMYLIRNETHCSVARIGKEMGGRDAAAVSNACRKVTSDLETSPYLKRKLQEIQQAIHRENG